jgi:hypothetical protein
MSKKNLSVAELAERNLDSFQRSTEYQEAHEQLQLIKDWITLNRMIYELEPKQRFYLYTQRKLLEATMERWHIPFDDEGFSLHVAELCRKTRPQGGQHTKE